MRFPSLGNRNHRFFQGLEKLTRGLSKVWKMTLPLPITVAATGIEGLVWLVVIFIWFIVQGLAKAKKNLPPPEDGSATSRSVPQPSEQTPRDELRELIEALTGQKPPMTTAEEDEDEEPPALPRPAPKPVVLRSPTPPPSRFSRPPKKMERFAQRPPSAPRNLKVQPAPPPVPPPVSEPAPAVVELPPAATHAALTSEALRLAPLMKMTWPRSQFQRLAGAAQRNASAARLKQQLHGRNALRQAMISRIVLGPPGGR